MGRRFGLGLAVCSIVVGWSVGGEAGNVTTLKLVIADEPFGYQPLIESFERQHPGLRVELTSITGADLSPKVVGLIAAGSPPDVVYSAARTIGEFIRQGVLQPLDSYIKRDFAFDLSDFFPRMLEASTVNGQLYMLPRGNQVDVMYYNTTAWAAAGLARPSPDWRWSQEFVATARKLTRDIDGDGKPDQYGFWSNGDWWWSLVWANGAAFLSPDETQYVLAQPAGVRSIQFVADLLHTYRVAPRPGDLTGSGNLFVQGLVAMYPSNHTATRTLALAGVETYDVVELPVGEAGRASRMDGAGFAIPVGAAHPAEAWELIKHLTSRESLASLVRERPLIPTRRSVALGPFLSQAPPPANRQAFLQALAYARSPFVGGPKWPELQQLLNGALNRVWTGEWSASQALAAIAPAVEGVLRRAPRR